MSVNGVGGAASLPVPLPVPVPLPHAAGAAGDPSADPATDGGAVVRLPGARHRSAPKEAAAAPATAEAPKPEPLPPLKGLTLAEIRAMLGLGTLPKPDDSDSMSSPSVQFALNRYA
ncbi:MAG TPA: hypothetical protein VI248_13850 [Kineosporiaceae bacterium]